MRTLNTMNIPNTAKRPHETNEDAFLRIIDTFMGEYQVESYDITESLAPLGEWVMKYGKLFKKGTFPVAWFENEDGFLTDYFIYSRTPKDKILRHKTVEL